MLRPRLQAVREEKAALENDLPRIQREIEIASSAGQTMQEHLEGLKQLMDVMDSLEGQQRIELRLRLRNEIRRLIERIEIYPVGTFQIPGVITPSMDDLELHVHFKTGRGQILYPHTGVGVELRDGFEGEY